jgi:hypothetical protein
MKKIIRLTEQQLNNVINRVVDEEDNSLSDYPVFVHHWENKFEKSVEILLKMGHTTDDLMRKINEIHEKNR